MNQPVPDFTDWSGDSLPDLFVTDEDGRLQYFLNTGTAAKPYLDLQTLDFQGLQVGNWIHFADYDHDGDSDLLCGSPGTTGIAVYRNEEGYLIRATAELTADDNQPILVGLSVIPTLADIDGDGWQDLFIGTIAGTVIYYRCSGVANGLPVFHWETNTFQGITIVWTPGKAIAHGANALEFYDLDADGDLDLLWGDYYQPGLFYLPNLGTVTEPFFTQDTMSYAFPEYDPLNTAGFNVPRVVDMDNDGDGDLFAGVLSGGYGFDVKDNFWYYENTGSAAAPFFTRRDESFIGALDLGSESVPSLADIDNDGDLDLFIGNAFNSANPGWSGEVAFFRNVGSHSSPVFELADSNIFDGWLGNNLAPTFGDLDGDGDLDALVGEWNGKIYRLENTGSTPGPTFTLVSELPGIDLAGRATPMLTDLDGDHDLDLLAGAIDGRVHAWENSGSVNEPQFQFLSDDYLGVEVGDYLTISGLDMDIDGDVDLIIGNIEGELFLAENSGGGYQIRVLSTGYAGRRVAPAAGDLNGDGIPDLMIGSLSGGLQLYWGKSALGTYATSNPPSSMHLGGNYPNPFNLSTTLSLYLPQPSRVKVTVYDLLGREVQQLVNGQMFPGRHSLVWHGRGRFNRELPSGIYFARLETLESTQSHRMILLK